MSKRIALAILACAGLGFVAGSHNPTAERRSSPGSEPPAAVNRISPAPAPIETPLVEKVLPTRENKPAAPADGQLSPRGEWQWSESQWAWVPVKKPGPAWVQDGHSATIDHLVREHGYSRASLEKLTQSQLDTLHSNAHNAARGVTRSPNVSQKTDFRNTSCPSGNCPNTNVSRGLFGRWR